MKEVYISKLMNLTLVSIFWSKRKPLMFAVSTWYCKFTQSYENKVKTNKIKNLLYFVTAFFRKFSGSPSSKPETDVNTIFVVSPDCVPRCCILCL